MSDLILEWVKVVGGLVLSWPVVVLLLVLLFREKLAAFFERFLGARESKAEIGPIKIELGELAREGREVIGTMNRLNLLMAESRLLELEITEGNFGAVFTPDQRSRMQKHITDLRTLTASVSDDTGS